MSTLLHVIDTGGPGGAETVFTTLAAGLDRPDRRSIAVVSREGWLAEQLRSRGLEPLLRSGKGGFNLRYLRALISDVRCHRPEAILAHLYGASVYAALAGILTSTPVIAVLHGQTDVASGRLAGLKAAVLRAGTRRVAFVSEALRDQLAPKLGLPTERTTVIANGVDLSRFDPSPSPALRAQLRLADDVLLVGAVGNLRAPKGYDGLLHAARHVLDTSIEAHFVVAGEPQQPLYGELLALRRQLGLDEHVTFLGLRSDVPTVLRGLDVFVSSSTTEGFSIACVEAMACARPVVATRSGGPETILEDGITGLLVPVQAQGALAGAIVRLGRDSELRGQLGLAARRAAEQRFSVDATVARYEALVQEIRKR